jgi:hypothetical protein
MKDLIDDIYDTYLTMVAFLLWIATIVSSPLWIIPYAIYKARKGDDK